MFYCWGFNFSVLSNDECRYLLAKAHFFEKTEWNFPFIFFIFQQTENKLPKLRTMHNLKTEIIIHRCRRIFQNKLKLKKNIFSIQKVILKRRLRMRSVSFEMSLIRATQVCKLTLTSKKKNTWYVDSLMLKTTSALQEFSAEENWQRSLVRCQYRHQHQEIWLD